jgi:para-aminobenzoate synthetase component I
VDGSDADGVTLTRVPRDLDGRVDLDRVAATLHPADVLETAPGYGGWSYVVPHVADRLVDDGERTTWLRTDGGRQDAGDDPHAAIDRWCARHGVDPHATPDPQLPPFSGGLVGALGYDLGRRTETIPALAAADREPLHLSLRVAPVVVAVTPDREDAWLVTRAFGEDPRPWAARVRARLAAPVSVVAPARPRPSPVETTLPRAAYLHAVEEILGHIAAGDAFQVNLAQRLTLRTSLSTAALYRRLRDASPAPHAALLPDIGVASVSPETFLHVHAGTATARPIKGTRPRHDDPDLDAANADDLATSAKDRAENVMIVDLERNDLGRVCRPGTVRAPTLCAVEAHPTVWHLVSEVVGELRSGVGYGELLRATFPCGSITGAPKIAAMHIIERLEPVRRGWYCGAVGFLAPGAASLSVAIRTATRSPDGTVDHGAGGGIVADSDPAAEHAESLAKAAAFLTATGAGPLSPPARSAGFPRAHGDAG